MKDTAEPEMYLVVAGRDKRCTQGAVSPVIQHASSLIFDTAKDEKPAIVNRVSGELFCGRRGTYTHFAFQKAVGELKGGVGCALCLYDAVVVTNAILTFVQGGDHILMTGAAYEPAQDFYNKILSKSNVETTHYDPLTGAGIIDLLRPEAKVILLESLGSVTVEVQDVLRMVKAICVVNPEIVTMIDNVWAAGVLFKILDYGMDISIQAGTKYTIGHSDVMLGTVVSNVRCWDRLRESSYLMGQTLDIDTTYNGSRGLYALTVRFKQYQESSIHIARWPLARPEVARVSHPTSPECPGHRYFQRDFIGSSDLSLFVLKKRLTDEQMTSSLDNFSLFHTAYSRGGFESLILANQPGGLDSICPAREVDFNGMLVRVHVGLEDIDDLTADLEAGFARIA